MIFSDLATAGRYIALHPLFFQAFEYIRHTDLRSLAPGRYDIVGDDLFAIVEHVHARSRADAQLECHRRYIDIQLVLDGEEQMGWKPMTDCKEPVSDYSKEKDIRFFHDAPASWISVPSDHFCIFFPEDTHAPLVGSGNIRKVIFKVAVSPINAGE